MHETTREPIARVEPLLVEDEVVWAAYVGPQSLVATNRRVFFVTDDDVSVRDMDEISSIKRERDTVAVMYATDGSAFPIELRLEDDAALQQLTVIALLAGRRRALDVPL